MDLKSLFTLVLVNSGQFLIDPDEIELNDGFFAVLVNKVLSTYNRFCPHDKHFNLIMDSRNFKFTDSTIDANGQLTGVPTRIISAVPVRISGVYPFYLDEARGNNPALIVKTEYPIVYRQPDLVVPVNGQYDIHAMYDHQLRVETIEGKKLYYLDTIDKNEDHLFVDLVTAHVMIGLGRSRRAFTVNELPLLSDAQDMVSDGKELLETTVESLKEDSGKWYLAWRGI